jgi:hypothetical protein
LINIVSGGQVANGDSGQCDVSDDGSAVVFASEASNLVPGDLEGKRDVFLRNRILGITVRLSQTATGQGGLANSNVPRIAGAGSHVLFTTASWNLCPDPGGANPDWMVYDLSAQVISVASVGNSGIQPSALLGGAGISDDGRYVAFGTAVPLQPGASSLDSFYVRDRWAGTTTLVSVSTAGVAGNGYGGGIDISGNGRIVAFMSRSTNLVPDDTNGVGDVFVHDLQTRTTIRGSVGPRGGQNDSNNIVLPVLDHAGRRLAFLSDASALIARPLCNNCVDVFVVDLGPGEDLGSGSAGSLGIPYFRIVEQAQPFPWIAAVRFGPPNAAALFAVSSAPASIIPFGTGGIVPWPADLVLTAMTDPWGNGVIPFAWLSAIPAGTPFWAQWAIADPVAPQGLSLSNAYRVARP